MGYVLVINEDCSETKRVPLKYLDFEGRLYEDICHVIFLLLLFRKSWCKKDQSKIKGFCYKVKYYTVLFHELTLLYSGLYNILQPYLLTNFVSYFSSSI